jgi:ribose transport system permease protein
MLSRTRRALSFRNVSAFYLLVVLLVLFAFWVPARFFTIQNFKIILEGQATTGIATLALLIALASGAFDLAVGTEVGLGAILIAWLLAFSGIPLVPAIMITLVVGGLVGLVSGLIITKIKIDSFIATLAMSSILTALVLWISSNQQIVGIGTTFGILATSQILGITLPVYIFLALALIVWYVLEATPAGRRVYATGGNLEAARLAGVSTSTVIILSLVACGVLAALAGILETASLGGGDPMVGPSYLLPAFTASFLGSTQFRRGRFNVWGTVFAIYVLQVGVQGLELAGAPIWIPNLFDGVALIFAVGLARFEVRSDNGAAIRRLLRFGSARRALVGSDQENNG